AARRGAAARGPGAADAGDRAAAVAARGPGDAVLRAVRAGAVPPAGVSPRGRAGGAPRGARGAGADDRPRHRRARAGRAQGMIPAPGSIRSILATDCGSTTTKAILIERTAEGYRLATRGEAPTTVEAPFEDVTRGVLNAVREVEELRGRRLLDGDRILSPQRGEDGVDLYLSTSSAGGGLQMMVSGLVLQMTGES